MAIAKTADESNGAQVTIDEARFQEELGVYVGRWSRHANADLDLRRETGAMLNSHFGQPGPKLKRGAEQLKKAAEQLRTTMGDLSRMRWFASHFKSVEDLKGKHPEVTTWTAVKGLLPTLAPTGARKGVRPDSGPRMQPSGGKDNSCPAKELKTSLEEVSTKLRKAKKGFSAAEKDDLLKTFRALAKEFEDCLRVRVTVDDAPAKLSPYAPEHKAA